MDTQSDLNVAIMQEKNQEQQNTGRKMNATMLKAISEGKRVFWSHCAYAIFDNDEEITAKAFLERMVPLDQ